MVEPVMIVQTPMTSIRPPSPAKSSGLRV